LKNQEQIFVKKEFVKETLFNEPWLIEKRNNTFQREKFHVQALKQEEMEIEQEENNFMEIKELKENEPLNIKVAIFEKEKIIPYRRGNGGTGQRLSITLQDKNGEQINATFFDESAEYYNPLIEKGKVYKMKRGRVKTVPEKFRK